MTKHAGVKGYFGLVLHTHLPSVLSHGRWPHGTDWISEAATECYIPLLDVFHDLLEDGISPHVTIGITPVLMEQLDDDDFRSELTDFLNHRIESAEHDVETWLSWHDPHFTAVAEYWRDYFRTILDRFENRYHRNLLEGFRTLQERGAIEVICCGATHGYFPLLSRDSSIQAQVKQGKRTYRRHMGRDPRGIWLPECAYRPAYSWSSTLLPGVKPYRRKGVEEFLSENGIEYFIVDSPLLMGGEAVGVYIDRYESLKQLWNQFSLQYREQPVDGAKSPYKPYLVVGAEGKKPVALFTRDPKTALQVWSGEHGYPGDGWYLDFHKKHFPGGHRYWRVTTSSSDLADKKPYEPDRVPARIEENALHFKDLVKKVLIRHERDFGAPGVLTAPFDTELFGHWWHEGPRWLEKVIREISADPEIGLTTLGDYLSGHPPTTVVSILEGSWGKGGFHYIWMNEWNEWTWKHIYKAEERMAELIGRFGDSTDERLQAILKQLARELFLLQSSDWQFLISTWSARDYAELRLSEHFEVFERLAAMAENFGDGKWVDPGEWTFLGDAEKADSLFPDVEPAWFGKLEYPPE